jgi:1-deoxyxylulose-5-phosphate synthase
MKYRSMGRTGLLVSEFSLGTMNFGDNVAESDAIQIIKRARELGVNHFDTAEMYPPGKWGISEEILGKAVKDFRNDVLITTKVGGMPGKGPNDRGLSRYNIISALEKSLARLQTDHIDIYLAHGLDTRIPLDESLRAFDDLVRSGKVRYIGCSNYDAWQMCKSLWVSDKSNLVHFNCIQARYNLITRSVETELLPFCASEGVGMFVFNPLAGGLLTGGIYKPGGNLVAPYAKGAEPPKDGRFGQPAYRARYWHERNLEAVSKLQNIAKSFGHAPSQIGLAWLLLNKTVTSVLTSADYIDQLNQNLSAIDISLSEEEIKACNEIYEAMLPIGWTKQEGADMRNQWRI